MFKRIPDSIVIVFFIMVMMMALSWIIPAGSYERETRFERTVVIAGRYYTVASSPQNPWHLMQAPFLGFTAPRLPALSVFCYSLEEHLDWS